jgi:hypothetical protein
MFHVGHAGCLGAKVVDDKAKGDVTPHVTPKSRHVLTLITASDGKALLKEFVCKDAGLWEPVYTLANFNIHPSISNHNFIKIVFVNYFLGKDIQLSSNRNWQGQCHRTMRQE